jgi:hypothetical protein
MNPQRPETTNTIALIIRENGRLRLSEPYRCTETGKKAAATNRLVLDSVFSLVDNAPGFGSHTANLRDISPC